MLCYPCVSGAAFPHVVIASVHHVGESGFVFVTVSFVVAFGTGVCAVSMGPAVLCGSGTVVVVVVVVVVVIVTSSVSVGTVALIAVSVVAASITASSTIVVVVVVIVVDLGLDGCHGCEEGFHCCCTVGFGVGCIGELVLGCLGCEDGFVFCCCGCVVLDSALVEFVDDFFN